MATVGSIAIVLTASASEFERAMGDTISSLRKTERQFERSARRMQSIGRKWSLGVTAPITAGLAAVGKAAMDWEDQFAGVRKSVSATEEQFGELEKQLKGIADVTPIATREITSIAESAGQLGIQVGNVAEFTHTIGTLGATARIATGVAATGLAQIDNIMGTGQKEFGRYGSTVLALGNNLATTEEKIIDFTLNIAAAGRIARMAESQVMSIAGAFGSVGVESQAGGTAVSKMLAGMTEAVAMGDKRLSIFAATSGMSSAEFAAQWQEDAGEAFTRFVEGLGRSGDQAFAVLRNLGLADQRLIRGFLSVANAGDLLRRSMEIGNRAWEENIELSRKAEERFKTRLKWLSVQRNYLTNTLQVIGNAFDQTFGRIFSQLETMNRGLRRTAEGFAKLPAPVRGTVGSLLLLAASIGPAMIGLGLLQRTIGGVIASWGRLIAVGGKVIVAFKAWTTGAMSFGQALVFVAGNPVMAAIIAIGALILVGIWLANNWEAVKGVAIRVWSAISAVVLYAASLIVRGIAAIVGAWSWMIPPLRNVADAVMDYGHSLADMAQDAWDAARTITQVGDSAAGMADSANQAADAQGNLGEAIAEAAELAGDGLQSFDEVHQLQDSMAGLDFSFPGLADIDMPELPQIAGMDIAGSMGQSLDDWEHKTTSIADKMALAFDAIDRKIKAVKESADKLGISLDNIAKIGLVISLSWIFKLLTPLLTALWAFLATLSWPVMLAVASVALVVALAWKFELLRKLVDAFEAWRERQVFPQELPVGILWLLFFCGWIFELLQSWAEAFWQWFRNLSFPERYIAAAAFALMVYCAWQFGLLQTFAAAVASWMSTLAIPSVVTVGKTVLLVIGLLWGFELLGALQEALSEWWAKHGITAADVRAWASGLAALPLIVTISIGFQSLLSAKVAFTAWWDAHKPTAADVESWIAGAEALLVTVMASVVLGFSLARSKTILAFSTWWSSVWDGLADTLASMMTDVHLTLGVGLMFALTPLAELRTAFLGWWNAQIAPVIEALQEQLQGVSLMLAIALGFSLLLGRIKDAFTAWWDRQVQSVTVSLQALVPLVMLTIPLGFEFVIDAFKQVEEILQGAGVRLKEGWQEAIEGISDTWADAKVSIPEKAAGMAKGITDVFAGMGTTIPAGVAGTVALVIALFQNMSDVIVGHSIVPDMAAAVQAEFRSLDSGVTTTSANMAGNVTANYQAMHDAGLGLTRDLSVGTQTEMSAMQTRVEAITDSMTTNLQNAFGRAFDDILSGGKKLGSGMGTVFSAMSSAIQQTIVQDLAKAAASSLSTLTSWTANVIAQAGSAVVALLQQAYATLVAFFAWSGPAAPALAAGVIAASMVTLGKIASDVFAGMHKVPKLAKGGIADSPTLAMIGEGHRREAVVPLERDNVIADSVGKAVYEAMTMANRIGQATGGGQDDSREIVLKLDSTAVARAILPAIIQEGQRQGFRLVVQQRGV